MQNFAPTASYFDSAPGANFEPEPDAGAIFGAAVKYNNGNTANSRALALNDPEKLGKYQIKGILGEGGMGIVYEAYDPNLARTVAIKTIRRSLLEGKSGHELRERFRREARAEGKLLHSNIVGIYEYQEDEQGMPFFVMEYVQGQSLKDLISQGIQFNLNTSLRIVSQILQALAYSHKQGIVHRDIKPANILLVEDGSVKIADFGIAKMEESEYTQTGVIMGTPHYISPEQRVGRKTDSRTDLYSTGAVLYELLTGEKASPVRKGEKLKLQQRQDSTVINAATPSIQRIFKQVLPRALAENADDRFSNAHEFLGALQSIASVPKTRSANRSLVLLASVLGLVAVAAGIWKFQTPIAVTPGTATETVRQARSKPLSPEDSAKIERLLKIAGLHMKVGRLIIPQGSSAYHSYSVALDIDPRNKAARSGIDAVETRLQELLPAKVAAGELDWARSRIQLARTLFPDNPTIKAMEAEL